MKGQRGNGAAIAVIEDSHVIDTSGKPCFQTIRRVDCHILCENPASSPGPLRCDCCKSLRGTLRSALSRQKSQEIHPLVATQNTVPSPPVSLNQG